jgi:cell division protein FtsB
MEVKKIALRVFFVSEIAVFLFFYFLGSQGLSKLLAYKQQNQLLQKDIEALEKEVSTLRVSLAEWQALPFYKEKFAREELQMAYPHEELYLYKEKI